MEDLIPQYMIGRHRLRQAIRKVKTRIRSLDPETEQDHIDVLEADKTILESMIRDMTEVIGILRARRTFADTRNYQGAKMILMDPAEMRGLAAAAPAYEVPDLDLEDTLRQEVLERFGSLIEERMGMLTIKQRTTLDRWIAGSYIADIAREDCVSRQAIWIRLFGDKTNRGALRILRGE